jgi:hypothetical protein
MKKTVPFLQLRDISCELLRIAEQIKGDMFYYEATLDKNSIREAFRAALNDITYLAYMIRAIAKTDEKKENEDEL